MIRTLVTALALLLILPVAFAPAGAEPNPDSGLSIPASQVMAATLQSALSELTNTDWTTVEDCLKVHDKCDVIIDEARREILRELDCISSQIEIEECLSEIKAYACVGFRYRAHAEPAKFEFDQNGILLHLISVGSLEFSVGLESIELGSSKSLIPKEGYLSFATGSGAQGVC